MKKATLCHCRPGKVQPGQVERVVQSLYPSEGVRYPEDLLLCAAKGSAERRSI